MKYAKNVLIAVLLIVCFSFKTESKQIAFIEVIENNGSFEVSLTFDKANYTESEILMAIEKFKNKRLDKLQGNIRKI